MAKTTSPLQTVRQASKKAARSKASTPAEQPSVRRTGNGSGDDLVAAPAAMSPNLMAAPESGVKIRMYRQGHGDCFLLAFRQADGTPFYMLIDCGMKKGSQIDRRVSMGDIAGHIRASTGGRLHLVVITHEHEDHVSGFLSEDEVFSSLTIDRLWLAWTEKADHPLAKRLRKKYKDTLLGLAATAERLRALNAAPSDRVRRILDSLLGFELSDQDLALAARDPDKIAGITNKKAILVVKRRADKRQGTEYLRPHEKTLELTNVPGVRIFVLGPPEDEAKLKDMDPRGAEEFPLALRAAEERAFLAAAGGETGETESQQPFATTYRIPLGTAAAHEHAPFFKKYYGLVPQPRRDPRAWRRIDADWLRAGEQFALRMNTFVNNTSLVLAIELPKTKKVLLFTGDAQRGNWASWKDGEWTSKNGLAKAETVQASDLLQRTVFYKVGHHGSENATLNAGGLREMAQDAFRDHFVAMVPANEQWALNSNDPPWRHPYGPIYQALLQKARGRVLVMDRDVEKPTTDVLSASEWRDFLNHTIYNDLFIEFTVQD